MDRVELIFIGVIIVTAIYRLLYTLRKSRMNRNRGDDIRRKLEQLRKKRDED